MSPHHRTLHHHLTLQKSVKGPQLMTKLLRNECSYSIFNGCGRDMIDYSLQHFSFRRFFLLCIILPCWHSLLLCIFFHVQVLTSLYRSSVSFFDYHDIFWQMFHVTHSMFTSNLKNEYISMLSITCLHSTLPNNHCSHASRIRIFICYFLHVHLLTDNTKYAVFHVVFSVYKSAYFILSLGCPAPGVLVHGAGRIGFRVQAWHTHRRVIEVR